HFAAQHGTAVVNQIENQRFLAEIISNADGFPSLLSENQVRRNLLIQMLRNSNVSKPWWTHIRRGRHNAAGHTLAKGTNADKKNHCERGHARAGPAALTRAGERCSPLCRAGPGWAGGGT